VKRHGLTPIHRRVARLELAELDCLSGEAVRLTREHVRPGGCGNYVTRHVVPMFKATPSSQTGSDDTP